ncbi:MAG: HYR domain-containing protein, partial [Bacteroidetes bacterium]|nr:HYR domain-containing protein [Bacteroidota bacterium]
MMYNYLSKITLALSAVFFLSSFPVTISDTAPFDDAVFDGGVMLNNCLDFTNSSDRVSIPSAISGNNVFTIEAWFLSSNITSGAEIARLITWGASGYRLEIGDDDGELIVYDHNAVDGSDRRFSGVNIRDGSWHHLAYTKSGNNCQLYVDGSLELSYSKDIQVSTNLKIGHWNATNDGDSQWIGQVDEVNMWNVVRTDTEIQATMGCKLEGDESGLVGYWNFDQGIAAGNNTGLTTLDDLHANGNDGTLTDFTLSGMTSNWVTSENGVSDPCLMTDPCDPDTENPIIENCPGDIVLEVACPNDLVDAFWTVPVASDNCVLQSFLSTHNPGDLLPVGMTTVTYTATDEAGNTSECSFVITVQSSDASPPLATCTDITVNVGNGSISIFPSDVGSASDNCPDNLFEDIDISAFDCSDRNTTTQVTYTATDEAGNSSQCTANVFAIDLVDPVISCPDDITVECLVDFNDPNNTGGFATATDICDPNPTITHFDNASIEDPCDIVIQRVWTATDDSGNSASCTQTIHVVDDTPPIINCPDNMQIECDSELDPAITGL